MPPINQAAVSAGVIAVSVAVAAAIALYESPELQRMANDLRRRIALALHSLGDGIQPEHANNEPLFNRPEDAEGFLKSQDVDADDETRRRQREELMYWNAMKLSRELEKQTVENEKRKTLNRSSTSFDDFLQEDKTAEEKGTYVYNTGADVRNNDEDSLCRRRGLSEGVRGLNASLYANPFADEHGIDYDEQFENSQISPERDEVASDYHNATPKDIPATPVTRTMTPESLPPLIPIDSGVSQSTPELSENEYMTAGPEDDESSDRIAEPLSQDDAYASIQAWAQQQHSGADFYSPLPVTPNAPLSEMSDGELISEGQLTPRTETASVAESGVDVAHDAASQSSSAKYYDVLSDDEDGIATPAHSWSEVGSVISESEDGFRNAARA